MIVTADALRRLAPKANSQILLSLLDPLNKYLPAYKITTPLRLAHFLAQAAHEADGFKTLHEYASGKAYEGRKDLGNLKPGDGPRYKGRGIFQLTGRVNYEAYGRRLGINLVDNPARAADPDIAVRVACEYWSAKGLSAWADRDDLKEITRRINGGQNGLKDRAVYLARAKTLFRQAPGIASLPGQKPAREEVPDAPIAAEPTKQWWQSGEILGTIGTFLTSILAAANSPWGAATIAVLVIAGFGGFVIYRRISRERIDKPVV